MYCGKNKTALASQAQIAQALLNLLAEKSYQEISICELCREAGVSRQTFYSLFSSKDNVIIFILKESSCLLPAPDPSLTCLEQLCSLYSEYIIRQRGLIRTLVDNHIIELLTDSFTDMLTDCSCFLSAMDPSTRSYAASFLAGGFTSIARNYVLEDPPVSPDTLTRLCIDLFRGRLL